MVEGWVTEEEIREIAYNSVYSVYSVVDKVASVRTRHASRRILPMCSLEFMQLYFIKLDVPQFFQGLPNTCGPPRGFDMISTVVAPFGRSSL